ncbi:hypothetical protein HN011_011556 [Eciton burchellii]|nr:hypothetical protein HN011_011556 [Eciton burchellii]
MELQPTMNKIAIKVRARRRTTKMDEERTAELDIIWRWSRSPAGFDTLPSDNPICAQSQSPPHLQYVSSCLLESRDRVVSSTFSYLLGASRRADCMLLFALRWNQELKSKSPFRRLGDCRL